MYMMLINLNKVYKESFRWRNQIQGASWEQWKGKYVQYSAVQHTRSNLQFSVFIFQFAIRHQIFCSDKFEERQSRNLSTIISNGKDGCTKETLWVFFLAQGNLCFINNNEVVWTFLWGFLYYWIKMLHSFFFSPLKEDQQNPIWD